jgi:hypothetical protein
VKLHLARNIAKGKVVKVRRERHKEISQTRRRVEDFRYSARLIGALNTLHVPIDEDFSCRSKVEFRRKMARWLDKVPNLEDLGEK